MFIINIIIDGSPFIWGNRALIGLLNKSVAELSNSVPIGVNLTCNKDKHHIIINSCFDVEFHKFCAWFHLSIALVVVW